MVTVDCYLEHAWCSKYKENDELLLEILFHNEGKPSVGEGALGG
jgi:hypothetical protein